jgi:hypothetical protein
MQRKWSALWLGALTALALASVVAAPAYGRAQATSPTVVHLKTDPRQLFKATGVTLAAGDTVTIRASGRMHFRSGRIAKTGPAGIPWGPSCTKIAGGNPKTIHWPAPGIRCWSLIGRIGTGAPFEIGTAKTLHATTGGPLLIGLNDNDLRDNSGKWSVTVTVGSGSSTGPATPAPAKKSSSKTLIIGIVAGVLVLALLVLLVLRRRSKPGGGKPAPAPAPRAAPAAAPVPVAPVPAPAAEESLLAMPAGPRTGAVPESDSIDVNIFEVELTDGANLHIGYNFFPEGTVVEWRVMQNRVPVAVGQLVTEGGGSENHFETLPLGVQLTPSADGADVHFTWAINGVPFRYSVRRATPS